MQVTTLYAGEALSVSHHRCSAGPGDRPFTELHASHSISYVRRGSFGCVTRGVEHDMVAGSVMLLRPRQEYMATHQHHGCGDECVSIKLSPEWAERITLWDAVRLPPLPGLMVAGELLGVEEAAVMFIERIAALGG